MPDEPVGQCRSLIHDRHILLTAVSGIAHTERTPWS
jgi:hypothetical protein